MKIVVQRVSQASVKIDKKINGEIGLGFMILVGFEHEDTIDDLEWITKKVLNLRIFEDEQGVMNKNINDVDGGILIISQFTLHASTKKGNRPSYIKAARPEIAIPLYETFLGMLKANLGNERIKEGIFGAEMEVSLINHGPVTIIIDSKNKI